MVLGNHAVGDCRGCRLSDLLGSFPAGVGNAFGGFGPGDKNGAGGLGSGKV
jgi:hypothetical protein